jgi:NitT/TauT family transport system substrate-binding protein
MNKIVFFLSLILSTVSLAAEKPTLRIAVQAAGTVAWEMAAMPDNAEFQLAVQPVANAEAAKIALQSGAVDIIVSDWLWVARLRNSGADFSFYPYSSASGALLVADNSPIKNLSDLAGKRLGIAGGELDKNWLLLQAVAAQQHIDLKNVEKTFGAPPLISEQLKQNRVDAALTYWHFAARLEPQGYRALIDGKTLLKNLGMNENLPVIGYIFKQSWAEKNKAALNQFFAASATARNNLCHDDSVWQKVAPLTQADDSATQNKLRVGYCAGSITQWSKTEQDAASTLYNLMRKLSDGQLTGTAENLPEGTFWQ